MSVSNGTVYLGGIVECDSAYSEYGANININKGGKLVLTDGSEILLKAPSNINLNRWEQVPSDFRLTEETRDQIPRLMDGTGAIRLDLSILPEGDVYYPLGTQFKNLIDYANTPDKLTFVNCFVNFNGIKLIHEHRIENLPAQAPTYTSAGYTAGTRCRDCEMTWDREEIARLSVKVTAAQVVKNTLSASFHGAGEESYYLVVAFYDAQGVFVDAGMIACGKDSSTASFPLPDGCTSYRILTIGQHYGPIGEGYRGTAD